MTASSAVRVPARERAAASGHFDFGAGRGRHRVWGTACLSHAGLTVTLVGGEVPHVGAVAISIPRPSLAKGGGRSATTSVFTVVGHKEDELAKPFAAKLARVLNRTTVVVAGVHLHHARTADLASVFENTGRAVDAIIAKVEALAGASRRTSRRDGSGRERRPST